MKPEISKNLGEPMGGGGQYRIYDAGDARLRKVPSTLEETLRVPERGRVIFHIWRPRIWVRLSELWIVDPGDSQHMPIERAGRDWQDV